VNADLLASVAQLVPLAEPGRTGSTVRKARPERLANVALQAPRVNADRLALSERPGRMESTARTALPGRQASMVRTVRPERLASVALQGRLAHEAFRGRLGQPERTEKPDFRDRLVPRANAVPTGRTASPVRRVSVVQQDWLAMTGRTASPARRVSVVQQD
jgi:hypothetical protein